MSDTPPAQEATPATPAPAADDAPIRMAILEKELKEARQEAAKYRTERKAQEVAALEAEQKRLVEAGEFKTLAEQRAAELAQAHAALDATKATTKQLERYEAALNKQLAAQRADLPPHIAALLDKLDPADQLEWLSDNRAALRSGDGVGSPANGKRPAVAAADFATVKLPRI